MALRAAVVGVGHLGKEHARVYANLDDVELVAVCDNNEKQAKAVAKKWRTDVLTDFQTLRGEVDLVSVVVPTIYHFDVASFFLEQGVPCLVEKPMTPDLEQAKQLVAIAEKAGATLQVGHIERFNPAFIAVRELPLEPKFIECHRLGPFSFRSTDIGVVMDLMIHDLDIVLHLARADVQSVDSVGVNVISESEDIANARVRFTNGCVANINASRISAKKMRKIRIFSPDSYVSIDCQAREALIYRKGENFDQARAKLGEIDLTKITDLTKFLFNKFLKIDKMKLDDEEPLKKEIEAFVHAVKTGERPIVTGQDAMRAIALAEQIVKGFNA